jgi:ligand-binding SRPBCC domain-containing protein
MNLILKTAVKGNYKTVMEAFDRSLFEALKPSVGKMEIVEFTGSKKGDRVHMQFISPVKAEWISDIVEDEVSDTSAWFVDVGVKLPWPLATWRHRHIVEKIDEDNSMIIDDITYTGTNFLFTLFLYPALFFGFYPRKKIYKAYFSKLHNS